MAAVLSESVLDQNGPNNHFGQNDLIPNRILAFARPKWTKMVHFGPFRSVNRTLAIPEIFLGPLEITSVPVVPLFACCCDTLCCTPFCMPMSCQCPPNSMSHTHPDMFERNDITMTSSEQSLSKKIMRQICFSISVYVSIRGCIWPAIFM